MIVADLNLVAYLLIEAAQTPAVRRVRQKDSDWWLPPLWRSEFLSTLTRFFRADLLDERQALGLWRVAAGLFIPQEKQPSEDGILRLALERSISAYDAHYAALAVDLEVPLVTADRKLLQRCPDLAVSIDDFGV